MQTYSRSQTKPSTLPGVNECVERAKERCAFRIHWLNIISAVQTPKSWPNMDRVFYSMYHNTFTCSTHTCHPNMVIFSSEIGCNDTLRSYLFLLGAFGDSCTPDIAIVIRITLRQRHAYVSAISPVVTPRLHHVWPSSYVIKILIQRQSYCAGCGSSV